MVSLQHRLLSVPGDLLPSELGTKAREQQREVCPHTSPLPALFLCFSVVPWSLGALTPGHVTSHPNTGNEGQPGAGDLGMVASLG